MIWEVIRSRLDLIHSVEIGPTGGVEKVIAIPVEDGNVEKGIIDEKKNIT